MPPPPGSDAARVDERSAGSAWYARDVITRPGLVSSLPALVVAVAVLGLGLTGCTTASTDSAAPPSASSAASSSARASASRSGSKPTKTPSASVSGSTDPARIVYRPPVTLASAADGAKLTGAPDGLVAALTQTLDGTTGQVVQVVMPDFALTGVGFALTGVGYVMPDGSVNAESTAVFARTGGTWRLVAVWDGATPCAELAKAKVPAGLFESVQTCQDGKPYG